MPDALMASSMSLKELLAHARALGIDCRDCVEKSDLMNLLSANPCPVPMTPERKPPNVVDSRKAHPDQDTLCRQRLPSGILQQHPSRRFLGSNCRVRLCPMPIILLTSMS